MFEKCIRIDEDFRFRLSALVRRLWRKLMRQLPERMVVRGRVVLIRVPRGISF